MLASAGWWVAIVQLTPAVEPSVHRRLAEQQLLERAVRLQRLRPPHRQRDRQRRRRRCRGAGGQWGPTGSTRLFNADSAVRCRGCFPAALLLLVGGLVGHVRAAAHRPHARRADALGRVAARHRGCCSASARASSMSTTRSHSARPSARSSASAQSRSGRTAACSRGSRWPRCSQSRSCGRTTCSRGRRLASVDPDPLAIGGFVIVVAMVAWPYLPRRTAPVVAVAAVAIALLGPGAYTVADRGDAAHGCDPVGRPRRREPFRSGRIRRRRWIRSGRRSGHTAGGWVCRRCAGRRGLHARRWCRSANRRCADCRCGQLRRCADRGRTGRWRRARRPVERHNGERGVEDRARRQPLELPVDRRHRRCQQCRELPTRDRLTGHGDRRLQRNRPVTHARAVRGVRRQSARSITSSAAGGVGGGPGGQSGSTSTQITTWVANHFTAKTVGGVTIYDLTKS